MWSADDVAIVHDALVAVADDLINAAAADFDRRLRACGAPAREYEIFSAALFVLRCEALLLIDRLIAAAQQVH